MNRGLLCLLIAILLCQSGYAQKYADTARSAKKQLVPPAWNDTRIITLPTTKTSQPHFLDVYFMHRFGSIGGASGGGVHTLYGFDLVTDVVFGFDYAISKRIMIGFSRSKDQELIDLYGKYRILDQKENGSPVSIAIGEDIGFIPQASTQFYSGTAIPDSNQSFADRFDYLSQIIIASRINKHISLEIVPTLSHRNHVLEALNTNNNTYDANNIPAIGMGGHYMFNKNFGIVAEYYYIISKYRTDNSNGNYYNAVSCGIEVFTGGHVFEINLSNASALTGNNLIPATTDTWLKGGFKLGFTIMRAFNL
jgi:hypothetical protein